MKYLDGIKPAPKDRVEYFNRWCDHMMARIACFKWNSKKITVKFL